MRQIVDYLVIKSCGSSLFLGKHYGPGQRGKLWPNLGCCADPPIMRDRTYPLLDKPCSAVYLKYLCIGVIC